MRTDRVERAYCAPTPATRMDDPVPAGAYQHAGAGRFLAARGKRFSVCPQRRVPRGSGAPSGCARDLYGGKSSRGCAGGVSTGGIFSNSRPECPLGKHAGRGVESAALLAERVQPMARRIRRSLKPKRVVLISQALGPILDKLLVLELGCPVVLELVEFDSSALGKSVARLRDALAGPPGD